MFDLANGQSSGGSQCVLRFQCRAGPAWVIIWEYLKENRFSSVINRCSAERIESRPSAHRSRVVATSSPSCLPTRSCQMTFGRTNVATSFCSGRDLHNQNFNRKMVAAQTWQTNKSSFNGKTSKKTSFAWLIFSFEWGKMVHPPPTFHNSGPSPGETGTLEELLESQQQSSRKCQYLDWELEGDVGLLYLFFPMASGKKKKKNAKNKLWQMTNVIPKRYPKALSVHFWSRNFGLGIGSKVPGYQCSWNKCGRHLVEKTLQNWGKPVKDWDKGRWTTVRKNFPWLWQLKKSDVDVARIESWQSFTSSKWFVLSIKQIWNTNPTYWSLRLIICMFFCFFFRNEFQKCFFFNLDLACCSEKNAFFGGLWNCSVSATAGRGSGAGLPHGSVSLRPGGGWEGHRPAGALGVPWAAKIGEFFSSSKPMDFCSKNNVLFHGSKPMDFG